MQVKFESEFLGIVLVFFYPLNPFQGPYLLISRISPPPPLPSCNVGFGSKIREVILRGGGEKIQAQVSQIRDQGR